jgi:hypothetical protein
MRPFLLALFIVSLSAADPLADIDRTFFPATTAGEINPTRPAAFTFTMVSPGSVAERGGLKVGDEMLAIQGREVWSQGEFNLLRYALPPSTYSLDLIVRRGGELTEVTLQGIDGSWRLGYASNGMRPGAGRRDRSDRLIALGARIDDEVAHAYGLFPLRAIAQLEAIQHETGGKDIPWLVNLLTTYRACVLGDWEAISEPVEIDNPLFARLDGFWRLVAERRHITELPIRFNSQAYGEPEWFMALYYPWPLGHLPEYGSLVDLPDHISDALIAVAERGAPPQGAEFNRAMQRAFRDLQDQLPGNAGNYLGYCAMALLDNRRHGGWPFRHEDVWKKKDRKAVRARIEAWVAEDEQPYHLIGHYGLAALAAMDGDSKRAEAAVTALTKRSPYLAWRACSTGSHAARMHNKHRLRTMFRQWNQQKIWNVSDTSIYRFLRDRSSRFNDATGGGGWLSDGVPGEAAVSSDLLARALQQAYFRPKSWGNSFGKLRDSMMEVSWNLASGYPDAGEEAVVAFSDMHKRVPDMPPIPVLAGLRHAAAGRFDLAEYHIEMAKAVYSQGNGGQFLELLEQLLGNIRSGTEGLNAEQIAAINKANITTLTEGGLTLTGRLLDGKRVGPWTATTATGHKAWKGMYFENQPNGLWQHFNADGDLLAQGWTKGKQALGPWKLYSQGEVRAEGLVSGGKAGALVPTGPWVGYHPNGKRAWQGGFVDGSPRDWWCWWDTNGQLLRWSHFDKKGREKALGVWSTEGTAQPIPEQTSGFPKELEAGLALKSQNVKKDDPQTKDPTPAPAGADDF